MGIQLVLWNILVFVLVKKNLKNLVSELGKQRQDAVQTGERWERKYFESRRAAEEKIDRLIYLLIASRRSQLSACQVFFSLLVWSETRRMPCWGSIQVVHVPSRPSARTFKSPQCTGSSFRVTRSLMDRSVAFMEGIGNSRAPNLSSERFFFHTE
jgi:hypothetical protein